MKATKFDKGAESKLHFDNRFMENPIAYGDILLYQIGDWFLESKSEIEEHIQNCYEITFVVSGKGTFKTDGKTYSLKAGDIYIGLPGEVHSGIADAINPFRFFYLGFDFVDYVGKENPLKNIKYTLDNIINPHVKNVVNIDEVFLNIFDEMMAFNDYSTEMIKMYLKQIIILSYRNYIGSRVVTYSPKEEIDENKQIIYKMINYIECNFENIGHLPNIANKLGYSYYYLSHLFTKETGKTIQEFCNEKKIEKAKSWLDKNQMNITEIAIKLNYSSIHSFSRAFKKNTGISPTEYKKLKDQKIKELIL